MLRPLPDFTNTETLARLGKQYALKEAWKDAVHQLRDSLNMVQSQNEQTQLEGIQAASEAVKRMQEIKEAA